MKRLFALVAVGLVFSFWVSSVSAYSITPGFIDGTVCSEGTDPACWQGTDPTNPFTGPDPVDDWEFITGMTWVGDFDVLYKNDLDDGDDTDALFFGVYETAYFNDPDDPSEATISLKSGVDESQAMDCPECYLLVKDGASEDPIWYLYNLEYWNGVDDIVMTGFWPDEGAISHVTIVGNANPVPEPATMLLFGTGLIGLAGLRLRKKNK